MLTGTSAALKGSEHDHPPLIEAAGGVQTQHVPVIQAERLKLPHGPGPNDQQQKDPTASAGNMALADAGCSSPRLAHAAGRVALTRPEAPHHSWQRHQGTLPSGSASRLTAGGPSPGMCFYWAAGAVLLSSYRGQWAPSCVCSHSKCWHGVWRRTTRTPRTPAPHRCSSVCSSRTSFCEDPASWISVAPPAQRHPSSNLRSSSLILNLLPSYLCHHHTPPPPPPPFFFTPVPLPPSSSSATIHTGPPRNVPILVAGQHSHTTEASDGILAEQARYWSTSEWGGEDAARLYDHTRLHAC